MMKCESIKALGLGRWISMWGGGGGHSKRLQYAQAQSTTTWFLNILAHKGIVPSTFWSTNIMVWLEK